MRTTFGLRLALIALLTFTFTSGMVISGCGTRLAAPVQLSPAGDVAFYAVKIIGGVEVLQQVAIDAEAAKVMSTDDARKIITATRAAGLGGVALADSLKAGASAVTARDKAVATIRAALDSIKDLSPATNDLIGPYISVISTLLTVFQS